MNRTRLIFAAVAAAAFIFTTPLGAFSQDNPGAGAPPGEMGGPEGPPGGGMPGGGPGGPGGGGGPGGPPGGGANIGAEANTSEPVVSAAESQLADYDTIKNKEAVTTVFDFGLMRGYSDDSAKLFFRPQQKLTLFELARAVADAANLIKDKPLEDAIRYCTEDVFMGKAGAKDSPVTGAQTAGALLSALGHKGSVDDGLKRYDLMKGLNDLDLSEPIIRDNAARLIANALLLSDGSGSIPTVLHNTPVQVNSGTKTVDNTRIFYLGGSAVQNGGESVLVVRNSRIDGDTSVETKPLAGNPGGLLVGGSIRTTLAVGKAQAFYVNSEINSKDWAALSTDAATMATEPGQKELALYTYGGNARTIEGGYGVYSDLFCNAFLYGTKLDVAEVAIISGTYGAVTVGNIRDGEANPDVAAHLTGADKKAQKDKTAGSVITGGRNAIMIHAVNLPPYWANEGYSKEELPLRTGKISIHGSALATDLVIDKNLAYPAERQAYIDHHAGSVIALKSTNADIVLDQVVMKADPKGSGALIHTLINNDSTWMIKVPDGETYPGVKVRMTDMTAEGDILSEDYQRDMHLSLADATLTGKIVSGTVESWNTLCEEKGFGGYIIDPDGYQMSHGVNLTLDANSVWNVTGDSTLTALFIEEGAVISPPAGRKLSMIIGGVKTAFMAGNYVGDIEIKVE